MSKYELIERLSASSSAEVFRGRALASSGFEKPIAVKRLLPHLQRDQRYVDWLLAEAKLVSNLRHRNIVQVFDVGLGEDGAYLLVLEYVDGANVANLQTYCEARHERISLDLALHIAAEVAEALEFAHSALGPDAKPLRVVHRDVSPPNILLSLAGEVKLTDFGFATRPEGHRLPAHRKAFYVSPEFVAGEALDARSDVFSLGIVLFELVTGQRLYSGMSEASATAALLDGRVPRPRTIDADIPMKLDVLMMRALARNPADRPQTAGQFAAMLRDVRYQLETTASDPALELAGLVARLAQASRQARRQGGPNASGAFAPEVSIIHIKPAAFHAAESSDVADVVAARAALDRFEIEETKMAQVERAVALTRAATNDIRTPARRSSAPKYGGNDAIDDEATRIALPQPTTSSLDDEATRMVPEVPTVRTAVEPAAPSRAPSQAQPRAQSQAPSPPTWSNDEATRMAFDAQPITNAAPVALDEQTVMNADALVEELSQTEPPRPQASANAFEVHERTMAIDPSMFEDAAEHTMAVDASMLEDIEAPETDGILRLRPQELAATQQRMDTQRTGNSPFLTPSYAPAALAQTHLAPSPTVPAPSPTAPAPSPYAATQMAPAIRPSLPPQQFTAPSGVRAPGGLRGRPLIFWIMLGWGVVLVVAILIALL